MEFIEIVKLKRSRDGPMQLYETRCFDGAVYTPEDTQGPKQEAPTVETPEAKLEAPEAFEDDSTADVEIKEDSLKDFYKCYVGRTAAQCLLESSAPQRSLVWLEARKYCITASNFGAAVGHNVYMSPEQLVADKIWSCFKGNAMTAFGTFHERDASKSLEKLLDSDLQASLQTIWTSSGFVGIFQWRLHEVGLLKWHKKPWMAVSPDGLLELYSDTECLWILVEYKCPARQRDSDAHPYARYANNVPDYYMDQLQGVMGLLHDAPMLLPSSDKKTQLIGHALFVVWQKHQVHVTLVPFETKYYKDSLEPALRSWYFSKYLPRAYLKHTGSLVEGTLLAGADIHISSGAPK